MGVLRHPCCQGVRSDDFARFTHQGEKKHQREARCNDKLSNDPDIETEFLPLIGKDSVDGGWATGVLRGCHGRWFARRVRAAECSLN